MFGWCRFESSGHNNPTALAYVKDCRSVSSTNRALVSSVDLRADMRVGVKDVSHPGHST